MKVFITKFALGKPGIIEADIEPSSTGRLFGKLSPDDTFPSMFTLGKDAFPDRASAIADACKRRDRRIENLERQIEKLKAMSFS